MPFRRPAPPPPFDPLAAPNLTGQFISTPRTAAGLMRPAPPPRSQQPLPPPALRHYYGVRDGKYDDTLYLQGGASDVQHMRRALQDDGWATGSGAMLDFGCGAGRMIRHLTPEAALAPVWGVDIHAEAIAWAQDALSPPFDFATTTTAPHLPFEDRTFTVAYAGSVFTHIGELADAWLLELRRLLAVGGWLYLSITDAETLDQIRVQAPQHPSHDHLAALDAATGYTGQDWQMLITRTGPWAQRVIYNRQHFLARISRWFDVRAVQPQGYGWQTAILLRKRQPPR
ncbi:hypothetical protein BVG79_02147 [Ketogulonicigenium robustum]|uniref:Methyltransferase type 11 domain-containing protein n=1 Tax=Ketogulonicigenium robustum TaxID=92947 RepID=A0A1W6P2G8_9RHOB|nr:class I SAM-dependent methyltransferase [Ketogulonicigenium robustum]ARO15487.1 hypothetical protein BVG79_02147 [Ketogulonicigenium robustum]